MSPTSESKAQKMLDLLLGSTNTNQVVDGVELINEYEGTVKIVGAIADKDGEAVRTSTPVKGREHLQSRYINVHVIKEEERTMALVTQVIFENDVMPEFFQELENAVENGELLGDRDYIKFEDPITAVPARLGDMVFPRKYRFKGDDGEWSVPVDTCPFVIFKGVTKPQTVVRRRLAQIDKEGGWVSDGGSSDVADTIPTSKNRRERQKEDKKDGTND